MDANKFLETLNNLYYKGHSGILCKYYMQASTFSYELHDSNKRCYSKESFLFESDVIYYDFESFQSIINEILSEIEKIVKQINKQ